MDLEAYLERIDPERTESRSPAADLQCLQALTRLHTRAIAFENLNTLLRLPVPLELEALEAKLVRQRRGGYCFEQNGLFAAVLENVGFDVQRLAARVVWGQGGAAASRFPRTHMVLQVNVDGARYLSDVGFGGITPTAPLRLDTEVEQTTPHEPFRVRDSQGHYLLQAKVAGSWQDVYVFDLQPQAFVDYEMANHFVCTHPRSHFRHTLIAARAVDGGRYHLRNRQLTTFAADGTRDRRDLRGTQEFIDTLANLFDIVVPDTAAFAAALATNIDGDDLTR